MFGDVILIETREGKFVIENYDMSRWYFINIDNSEEEFCMDKRLAWEEIQQIYPDQWVGLVEVEYEPDNQASIKSAIVRYTDKTKAELTRMMLNGEIVSRYTTPDNIFQLGMVGVR